MCSSIHLSIHSNLLTRLSLCCSPLLERLLHRRPVQQLLHPSPIVGIILLEIDLFARKHIWQRPIPGDEGQIGKAAFIAHEVLARRQHPIQHLGHTPGFFAVALNRRGQFLRVPVREPGCLTEVRALAGHLKMKPLLCMVLLGEGGERDDVFGVVLLHQVFDNGAGFEDGDVCVRVLDCGDAAVKTG